jgi:hypothetical protein
LSILGEMLSGPCALYGLRYIKHKRKDNIGISFLMMDGKLFCDPASKSNILNRQFKSAFSANSKFTKKEFIKSKRMDPSIKHQTMRGEARSHQLVL